MAIFHHKQYQKIFKILFHLGDRITINIPLAELVDSEITYQSGSRATASNGTVVNVSCSRKYVHLSAVIVNDNDVLSYSTLRIYGRK